MLYIRRSLTRDKSLYSPVAGAEPFPLFAFFACCGLLASSLGCLVSVGVLSSRLGLPGTRSVKGLDILCYSFRFALHVEPQHPQPRTRGTRFRSRKPVPCCRYRFVQPHCISEDHRNKASVPSYAMICGNRHPKAQRPRPCDDGALAEDTLHGL